MFPFGFDFLCDGQTFLPADFLRHPCCPVAHEGGVIDLSVQTDAIGDDMNVSIVCILMGNCYPLVIVKSHFLGKQMGYLDKFRNW